MYVFCYGTLKQGYGNGERLLSGRSTLVTTGTLQGYKLYDSGFPVSAPSGWDSVCGEVFLIDEDKEASVLRSLDGLEGYVQEAPDISMYHRKTVTVFGDDEQTYECQTYIGNPKFWSDFKSMREIKKDDKDRYFWSR
jgi:gamma-glutamylcyclotransferase (GGCT)/AIG2-like uncharacterized protein YtfP